MPEYDFAGKHVLVTGASGGLGSAMARRLSEMGAHMVVTSRSMKPLDELISALPGNTQVTPITADLSSPGEAEELARKSIEALGFIDVLFNNAGVGYFALMEEAKEESLRHIFEVNTFSPLMLIKTLVPHMKARGGGRIVNIVSCAGRVPIPTVGVYGGSKSALAVMTNTMRFELAPSGIEIVNVYPGTIGTSFEENALRERERPGLCPADTCGIPRFQMADEVLSAASGPPGETWLEWQGKWMSVGALVWPGFVEKRLETVRDKVIKTTHLKKRRWRLLQLESSIACNLRCVMCPWRSIAENAENHGIMPQAVWDGVRPHLNEIKSIDFSGGGEPLLQPHLQEWLKEAKAAGCETGFLTNGLLLDAKFAREAIGSGVDWICVSMDGATADVYDKIRVGSRFDKVCENLGRIAELRTGKLPKTMINFVIMAANRHQLEEMVRLAARLGVDQLNFKQCDVIRGEAGKGFGLFASKETKEINRLRKELEKARRLAKKLGVATSAFDFTPRELPVCDQDPRDSLFVRHDGAVGPCINLAIGGPTTFFAEDVTMPTVHYGRLPEKDLGELWKTEFCQFYGASFEKRVTAHDSVIVKSFTGGAANREKAMDEAEAAMPEAPEGCRVCHYLYGV